MKNNSQCKMKYRNQKSQNVRSNWRNIVMEISIVSFNSHPCLVKANRICDYAGESDQQFRQEECLSVWLLWQEVVWLNVSSVRKQLWRSNPSHPGGKQSATASLGGSCGPQLAQSLVPLMSPLESVRGGLTRRNVQRHSRVWSWCEMATETLSRWANAQENYGGGGGELFWNCQNWETRSEKKKSIAIFWNAPKYYYRCGLVGVRQSKWCSQEGEILLKGEAILMASVNSGYWKKAVNTRRTMKISWTTECRRFL